MMSEAAWPFSFTALLCMMLSHLVPCPVCLLDSTHIHFVVMFLSFALCCQATSHSEFSVVLPSHIGQQVLCCVAKSHQAVSFVTYLNRILPRSRLALSIGLTWVGSSWGQRQNLVFETVSFKWKTNKGWVMSRIVIVILICHRHKPVDSINLLGS
jgi:hypothetical protein